MPLQQISQQQIRNLKFDTIAQAQAAGQPGDLCYVEETNTLYYFEAAGSAYSVNGTTVLGTAMAGTTRWVGTAGQYTYPTFIPPAVDPGEDTEFLCTVTEQIGDVVYFNTSGELRQADASNISTARAVGFIYNKPSATSCNIIFDGIISGLVGLSTGDLYFLSETPGQITNIAPLTSSSVIVPIGISTSSTELLINISTSYVIRA